MTEADAHKIRDWLQVEEDKERLNLLGWYNLFVFPWREDHEDRLFLVERNRYGYPIGFLIFNRNLNKIELIHVMEQHRRESIGSVLIEKLLEQSIGLIELNSTNKSYKFWLAMGFTWKNDNGCNEEDAKSGCSVPMIKEVENGSV